MGLELALSHNFQETLPLATGILIPSVTMSGVFLVAAKRTALGSFGGSLKGFSATDLAVDEAEMALDRANPID